MFGLAFLLITICYLRTNLDSIPGPFYIFQVFNHIFVVVLLAFLYAPVYHTQVVVEKYLFTCTVPLCEALRMKGKGQ